MPTVVNYADVFQDFLVAAPPGVENYPCLCPNWDNTPRSGNRGFVLHNSTPELFRSHVSQAIKMTEGVPTEHRLLFIKSWNEWAEGNYLEPDLRFGHGYLKALRDELSVL